MHMLNGECWGSKQAQYFNARGVHVIEKRVFRLQQHVRVVRSHFFVAAAVQYSYHILSGIWFCLSLIKEWETRSKVVLIGRCLLH
jgi:hypothetical protein